MIVGCNNHTYIIAHMLKFVNTFVTFL